MAAMSLLNKICRFYREEKPECRIYSAPGAMRNPEGVSYKPESKT